MDARDVFMACNRIVRQELEDMQRELKAGSMDSLALTRYAAAREAYFSYNKTGEAQRRKFEKLAAQARLQQVDRCIANGQFWAAASDAKEAGHPKAGELGTLMWLSGRR